MAELKSARDNPGTLREYECVLILRPDTLQEGILEINNKIKDLVTGGGGKIMLVENWGKRRLAYEIRKQLKGIYMYYQLLGHGSMVSEMERQLRFSEAVIRYFTLRLDQNVDPDARPGELTDEDFLAASATRPDEEELATGYVMTGSGEKIPVSELGYKGGGEEGGEKPADKKEEKKEAKGESEAATETPESSSAAPQDEAAEDKNDTADEAPETQPETDGDDSKGA